MGRVRGERGADLPDAEAHEDHPDHEPAEQPGRDEVFKTHKNSRKFFSESWRSAKEVPGGIGEGAAIELRTIYKNIRLLHVSNQDRAGPRVYALRVSDGTSLNGKLTILHRKEAITGQVTAEESLPRTTWSRRLA